MNTDSHNALRTIGQQPDALQYILDNNRFKHVQLGSQSLAHLTTKVESIIRHLKLTLSTRKHNGGIVPHHLCGDHCEGLALSRIDLAGHDARPRFIFWQTEFTQSASRT